MSDENRAVVPSETPDWSSPMLRPFGDVFKDIANTVVKASALQGRVDQLEARVEYFENTVSNLMVENSGLKAELRQVKEELHAVADERDQLRTTVEYTKGMLADTQTDLSRARQDHEAVAVELSRVNDEHALAKAEVEAWQVKHGKLSSDFEVLTADLAAAHSRWFEQEDRLQRQIRDLTAERNMFRDKFDSSKSWAAKIMALDQVKPQEEVQRFDA